MDTKKIIELRKQAEKAVSDMQDGEFKLKAFEVVLKHLLSPDSDELKDNSIQTAATEKKQKLSISKADERTAAGRILVLKDEDYFKTPKTIGEIRSELEAHGWHYPVTTLSGEVIRLVQRQELRRQKSKNGWIYTNS